MTKYILTPSGRKLIAEAKSGKTTFDVGDEVETIFGRGKITDIKHGETPHIMVQHHHIFPDQKPDDPDFKKPIKVPTPKHLK